MAESDDKKPVWDSSHKYEFCILSNDGSFWKGQKDKVIAEKKNEEDVWDFLHNNICNTEYPSPVLASKKELREIFEKFPGSVDKISFYRKTKDSETEEAPFGEHLEFSRKDFDEIMKEPDVVVESIMSKAEMEKLAKEMSKEFAKEAAKAGLSKEEVEKIVKKNVSDKISEMETSLARKIDDMEKSRKAEEKKTVEEKEAKVKSAMAEQVKEMVEEKAKAKLEEKLNSAMKSVGTKKESKPMSERDYKDIAKDAAMFAGQNIGHGVKQKIAGETGKLLIDALRAAVKDDPMLTGLLENEMFAQALLALVIMMVRTGAKETNMFPESVKGGVDELTSLMLQNTGSELIAPFIAKLKPVLLTLGSQAKKMQAESPAMVITDEDLDITVEEEEEEEKKEKKVARAGKD